MFRALVALAAVLGLLVPSRAGAQTTRLFSQGTSGTLDAADDTIVLATGGLASLIVQTLDSYSGTWELQCSVDSGTTYDTDDEVPMTLMGATSQVASVTDSVGIWQANVAGCSHVRVYATAWSSGDVAVRMVAITSGGAGGGGGGGSAFDGVLKDASGGDDITDTANNALNVNCVVGCGGSGGTAVADDADFVDGTTDGTPVGGVAESASPSTVTEGDFGWFAMTLNRALKAALFSPAGDSLANDTLDALKVVNPTNADATSYLTVRLTNGTSFLTTSSDVTEDAAETAGGTGPFVLSVRRDTAASSAGTSGDNASFNTDGLGRLWVRPGQPCADHARISTAAISTSSSGNVEIVALNGSDLIYVCGFSVVAGAATGVQLIYGTGTACATGETDLTGVWSFAANGGITQANAGVPQFVVPAGNAFCVENSGANAIAGHVTYVRTAAP